MLEQECDILIPAAVESVIHAGNADRQVPVQPVAELVRQGHHVPRLALVVQQHIGVD